MDMLASLMQYCGSEGRVCPVAHRWNELWELLPARRRVGTGWEPALPLILSAWWHTSNIEKAMRLREHLQWAVDHGRVQEVDGFLRELPEHEWHHLDD